MTIESLLVPGQALAATKPLGSEYRLTVTRTDQPSLSTLRTQKHSPYRDKET